MAAPLSQPGISHSFIVFPAKAEAKVIWQEDGPIGTLTLNQPDNGLAERRSLGPRHFPALS